MIKKDELNFILFGLLNDKCLYCNLNKKQSDHKKCYERAEKSYLKYNKLNYENSTNK